MDQVQKRASNEIVALMANSMQAQTELKEKTTKERGTCYVIMAVDHFLMKGN
jgi:hypothetical protein